MTKAEKTAFKNKHKQCQQLYRIRKQANEKATQSAESPYKARSTLHKAVKKALVALPVSARKRKKVITILALRQGVPVVNQVGKVSRERISSETKLCIANFYTRDDISWHTPGQKDCKTVKTDGGKKKVQKRFLLYTLREAYSMYSEEQPLHPLGFSKFCALRPLHVCLVNEFPQTVCVCKYHENIRLLLEPLRNLKATLPSTCREFVVVVSNSEKEMCMLGECTCCNEKFDMAFRIPDEQLENQVSWYQWENVNQRMVKVPKNNTVADCIAELKKQTPSFIFHAFVKRKQSEFFEQSKSTLSEDTVAVQVDFSENYTFKQQHEIQSAHWSNNQATIFTAYVWLPNGSGISVAFVSDYLDHEKHAVHTFLHHLIMTIKVKLPFLKYVQFFSDGAASQFKQKFLFVNITFFAEMYQCDASWHFFATSHGKGIVDGIGGTVKRVVWKECMTGHVIDTAEDFVKCAGAKCPNIIVKFISSAEIESHRDELDMRWKGISSLPNTQAIHCVIPTSRYTVQYSIISSSPTRETHCFLKGSDCRLKLIQPSLNKPKGRCKRKNTSSPARKNKK